MISTITTATATTIATTGAASLVVVSIVALVVLLMQKEIVGGQKSQRASQLNRALDIALIPLLAVFGPAVFFQVKSIFW
jgi:hypothetical protein